ncbi:hypothetical protein [Ectothiorhodospira lacustris]|uniref:CIS tube protein n=1 Tax=Ectothiorhodospira lacustris TaxID=2899127 RepID=UPI001EE8E874|nr:hypothetical protein [Ectothiorhodospira lacustris]MCG5501139.1 hypothetical protein [Ectothiorhodospira lacustris]MCG5511219.1 hypothetical protein [Ectothiorhodospira lacustris]MCG5522965.1 hypothetical protein [Ectothiorhodospira lacustris]
MEKVILLVEHTGDQIRCLMNPERLEIRRSAGVVPRHSRSGLIGQSDLSDDPVLYTGGGRTEIVLELLFDLSLHYQPLGTPPLDDVRQLTRPLWGLVENRHESGRGRPPLVRLLWGTGCNIPGIISAAAERLEQFTPDGRPRRSWLRLRFLRVNDVEPESVPATGPPQDMEALSRRLMGFTP